MAKSPFRGLLILAAIIALGIVAIQWFFPGTLYQHIWIMYGFLLVVSIGSAAILMKIHRDYPSLFLNMYLAIVVGRLFVLAGFAGVLIYYDRAHAMQFTISFLILYLLFHGFEIKGIISNLHHQIRKGNRDDQMP
ncbi:MAG: hypothetical protein U5K79_06540 [Cyclobacteriaceae bacterium]|nr:hypothetical protein [Cyclobacteriaceae bacterium]